MSGLYRVRMFRGTFGFTCKSESILTVSHILAHKPLTPCVNQEADALAQVQTLAIDTLVDIADWLHRKSGHHSTQVEWHVAKDAGLPLKYSDLVNSITACHVCST